MTMDRRSGDPQRHETGRARPSFSLSCFFFIYLFIALCMCTERERGGSFAREREACERFVTCFALSRLRAARVNLDIFVHIVLFVCCQPPINKLTSASRTICIQDALCLRV
jgi:hypothetical protein